MPCRTGVTPAGLGRVTRCASKPASPPRSRAGPGHHPAAGRPGLGRALGQGPLPGPGGPRCGARPAGVARRLRGLVLEGRGTPRQGYAVHAGGRLVGEVTSGNFSPTTGQGIALALLDPAIEPGAAVEVDIRGRLMPAAVVTPPFVPRPPA